MIVTFERGRILTKFIVAWILLSVDAVAKIEAVAAVDAVDAVGAPHIQRDSALVEGFSSKIADCCTGHRCDGYRGLKSTTKTGKTCQRWDSQTPHSHSITKERYPNSGLFENYCRNADHEPDGAWCYTTDEDTRWEYCGISDECPASTMMTAPPTTEFQQILPVKGDFDNLKNTINRCIVEKECDIINLGKQLSDFEERDAKLQKEASELKQQLKSSKESRARLEGEVSRLKIQLENATREQKSMKEEITKLREELKPILYGEKMKKTFKLVGEYNELQDYNSCNGCKNWTDAREDCQRRGGDLATHLSKEDLDYVYAKVIPSDKFITRDHYRNWRGVWVGGRMYHEAVQQNFQYSFQWVNERYKMIDANDGLWYEHAPIALYTKCMDITRNISPAKTKSGTKGPAYSTSRCKSAQPYLCEFDKVA